jgi:hypothetical protein
MPLTTHRSTPANAPPLRFDTANADGNASGRSDSTGPQGGASGSAAAPYAAHLNANGFSATTGQLLGRVSQHAESALSDIKKTGFFSWKYAMNGEKAEQVVNGLNEARRQLVASGRSTEAATIGQAAQTFSDLSKKKLTFDDRVTLASAIIDVRMVHSKLTQGPGAARGEAASLAHTALNAVRETGQDGALFSRRQWTPLAYVHAAMDKLQSKIDPAIANGGSVVRSVRDFALEFGNKAAGPGLYAASPIQALKSLVDQFKVAHNARHPNSELTLVDYRTG